MKGRLEPIRKAGCIVMNGSDNMKETSKEAKPHEGDVDNQLLEVIHCLVNSGPLTRRQIAEETDIQYSSITWRINDHFLGKEGVTEPLFQCVGHVVLPIKNIKTDRIRNIRYELIDLVNKQEELDMEGFPKYGTCAQCGAAIWIQWSWNKNKEYVTNIKERPEGEKQWPDGSFHRCKNWQGEHTYDAEKAKRKATGVSKPSPNNITIMEPLNAPQQSMELDREGSGSEVILDKLGATLVKLSLWEEKKVWGGSKDSGFSQTYNMGVEFAFDKDKDIDPDEALEQSSDFITRHINRKLGIK